MTIYPTGDGELERVLTELGVALDGEAGPYILSDLRCRRGPLYVRYGAFVPRLVRTAAGHEVSCIEDSDGRLVPDVRRPWFEPPPLVALPTAPPTLPNGVDCLWMVTMRMPPIRAMYWLGDGVWRDIVVTQEQLATLDETSGQAA